MPTIKQILDNELYTKDNLVSLLNADTNNTKLILAKAAEIKKQYTGNKVHLRGLIELTNRCSKNCYYCGIASGIKDVNRFTLSDTDIEKSIEFTINNNYGSIVIQSGELSDKHFVTKIENILHLIRKKGNGKLGVTLSCGEQTSETYKKWFDAGAQRYLLRIESSNEDLYYKLHPKDEKHDYQKRLSALRSLQEIGYQTGTGVMIGLPFQTMENLADDLLFMKNFDIDMCGMGPYIEHSLTELYKYKDLIPSKEKRLDLSLKMIALLRIMMKDINIASTTAMQTLHTNGRELALRAGANILMPNTTPGSFREQYSLYNNKPGINEEAEDSKISIEKLIAKAGDIVCYGEHGNSLHYYIRMQ